MKRIISLIIALALVCGSVFSLSSCLSAVGGLLDSLKDAQNQDGDGSTDGDGSSGDSSVGSGDSSSAGTSGSDGSDSTGSGSGTDSGSSSGSSGNSGTTGNSSYLPNREENAAAAEALTSQSRALLSAVSITANFVVINDSYFGGTTSPSTMVGSGVIYSIDREAGDAYIITNYHVVYDASAVSNGGISEDIEVYLYAQEYSKYAMSATYVGGSMTYDLAALKVDNSRVLKESCAVAARLGDSDDVRVLDDVIAVGNPEGEGISVTEGIISVESEDLSMTAPDASGTIIIFRVMRVSAAINSGNSGGGLYDSEGRLIGIVNAKKQHQYIDNIAYAIPINLVKNVVDNILYYCDGIFTVSVYKCVLGIKIQPQAVGVNISENGDIIIEEAIRISEVVEGSISEGKLLVGDMINSISIDGVTYEVTRDYHITDNMLNARVGSTVVLNVTRGAFTLDVSIVLTEAELNKVK